MEKSHCVLLLCTFFWFWLCFFFTLCCLNHIYLKLLNSICYTFIFFSFYIIFGLSFFVLSFCLIEAFDEVAMVTVSSMYSLIH